MIDVPDPTLRIERRGSRSWLSRATENAFSIYAPLPATTAKSEPGPRGTVADISVHWYIETESLALMHRIEKSPGGVHRQGTVNAEPDLGYRLVAGGGAPVGMLLLLISAMYRHPDGVLFQTLR